MTEAPAAGSLSALCDLTASTVADLTGSAHAIVWVLNRAGAEESARGVWGLDSKTHSAPKDCPALVRQFIDDDGLTDAADVSPEDLGLPPGERLIRVAGFGLRCSDTIGCWVGVMPTADLPALDTATRIVARHLGVLFEKHCVEMRRRASDLKYGTLVEQIPAVTYYRELGAPGVASFISPQIQDILGYSPEEFVSNRDFFHEHLHPEDRQRVLVEQAGYLPGENTATVKTTYRMIHKDGRTVWLQNHALSARDENGVAKFVIGVIFDVTETKELEQQYRHAQKMEAVGRLAGGVAHDFNNILAVILGFGWMITQRLPEEDRNRRDMLKIVAAGERATQLVDQLLAFSRRQVSQPERVLLGPVLDRMQSMFMRVVRDDVVFRCKSASDLGATWIDPGELEQVIMNLLVNANDAMPNGGRLNIEAANVELDQTFRATHHAVEPGPFVMFSVTDTGIGMDAGTQERIFEPFFTTKVLGKGTGLGLSTVHGIVQQNGGTVWVDSEPGRGTTIKVYLPRRIGVRESDDANAAQVGVVVGGTDRILVVEDDETLRGFIATVLEELGYSVAVAENGEAARRLLQRGEAVDLVLSDVIMRGLSGPALLADLRRSHPGLKTLLMSGYADDAAVGSPGDPNSALLRKPFTVAELAGRVRQALDGPPPEQ